MSDQAPAPAVKLWKRPWIWLVACLALGMATRVGAVIAFHSLRDVTIGGRLVSNPAEQPMFPDSWEYLRVAQSLRLGEGLTLGGDGRISRMPGYPLFLAGIQAVFGDDNLLAVRLAQAALGTAWVALLYFLARELYGRGEAIVAAAAAAVYPFFVLHVVMVLSEVLFIVFLLAGMACLLVAYRRASPGWAVLTGLSFGLAALVRASFLLFVFGAAVAWVVLRRRQARAWACVALMLAAFVGAMAPWVVRNWRASGGRLVVTTLRAGASLYEALNEQADGGPMMDRIDWDEGTEGMDDYERDRHWRRRALEFAQGHPGRVAVLAAKKLRRFWSLLPNLSQFRAPVFCVTLGVPYALVVLFGIVGLVGSGRRGEVVLILLLPVVYYSLVHMVFVGSVRYRAAVEPMLVVLAAHGGVALWSRWKRGRAAPDGDRARAQRGADGDAPPGAGAGDAGGQAGHRGG